MLPPGFLGTRGDILIDLVMVAFVVIVPVLLFSWFTVRKGGYALHRRTQLWLGITLAGTVLLFELDIRLAGGTFALITPSPYADTWWLTAIIYVHLIVAVVTAVVWGFLIVLSLKRFGNPPVPGDFSATHRTWGRVGMVGMMLTGLTAYPVYIFGFAM